MKLIPLTLCFFLGVLAFQQCKTLPAIEVFIFIPGLIYGAYISKLCYPCLIFCSGFYVALIGALWLLLPALDDELIHQRIHISGEIIQIYHQDSVRQRILLQVADGDSVGSISLPSKIQLNWYGSETIVALHDKCDLWVKLKPFYRLANPGSLDYEKLMYVQGIRARGYIISGECWQSSSSYSLREDMIRNFKGYQDSFEYFPIMLALSFGDRGAMEESLWQVLRITGTAHLMAISGMHISVICFLSFLLIRSCVSYSATLCNFLPAQHYAAIGSLLICIFYAYLAGFSLPTQRALIMVMVALTAILLYKPIFNLHALCIALLIILLLSPHAVLLNSFWFSFSAVGFIYLAVRLCRDMSRVKQYLFIQIYLSIALLPLSSYVFNEGSLISPIANLIAIPLVTFFVLPSLLITQCLHIMEVPLTLQLLTINDYLLRVLLDWLSMLAAFEFSTIKTTPSLIELILYECMLIALSIKQSWSKIKLAILFLPCMLFFRPFISLSNKDSLQLTVLDVGQGLSVMIEMHTPSNKHSNARTLLYDTGLSSSSGFNMGDAVIKPYMHTRNIRHLDKIIISHNDNDHIGGLESLLSDISVKAVMFNQLPEALNFHLSSKLSNEHRQAMSKVEFCYQDLQWAWGEVKFRIFHPPHNWYSKQNNRSCVLKIDYFEHSILLTGDIHQSVEHALVQQYGMALNSDILLAPHHGSQTSSSKSFIDHIQPSYVIFSAGMHNRYRHPHRHIVDRFARRHIHTSSAAVDGAISFQLYRNQAIQLPISYQQQSKRYWHSSRKSL